VTWRRTTALLSLLVMPLTLTSCGGRGSATASTTASTTSAPTHPNGLATDGAVVGVFRHSGGPTGAYDGPYSKGTITLTGTVHSYSVSVATDGLFNLSVPPGLYRMTATTPQYNSGQADCAGGTIRVTADRTTSIPVTCQLK